MSTRTQPRDNKTTNAIQTENEHFDNAPKFELFLNQDWSAQEIQCDTCREIVTGERCSYPFPGSIIPEKGREQPPQPFLAKDLTLFFNRNNVKVLHKMHKAINISKNFSYDFDFYFSLYFNEDMSNFRNKILLKSIYEQLFLRILSRKTTATIDLSKAKVVTFKKSVRETKSGLAAAKVVTHSNVTETEDVKTNIERTLNQIVYAGEEELVPFTTCVYIYFNCDLPEFQRMILIRYLKSKIKFLIEYSNKNETFLIRGKNTIFNYLKYLERNIDQEFQKYKNIKVQILEMLGMSGIGKSESVTSLTHLLEVLFPYIPCKDLIYSRANDYWWNGYCGQPVILYDDIAHSTKSRIDFVFELIAVGSSKFENVPMAFIKDMEFTSSLAILTGNFPIVTRTSNPESATALRRRIVSEHYHPLVGLGEIVGEGYFQYSVRGQLFNALEGKSSGRSIFSFFKETLDTLFNRQILDFDLSLFSFQNDTDSSVLNAINYTKSVAAKIVNNVTALTRMKETKSLCRILNKGGFIENIKSDKGIDIEKINEIFTETTSVGELPPFYFPIAGVEEYDPRTSSVSKSLFVNGLRIDANQKHIFVNDEFKNLRDCIADFQILQPIGWKVYDKRTSSSLRSVFFGQKNHGFTFN